jgi:predicted membrane protein
MSDNQYPGRQRASKMWFGVLVVLIGVAMLFRQIGLLPHFSLHLAWPVILIIVGLLIGIQKKFRNNAWWILILVGAFNIVPEFTMNIGGNEIGSEDLVLPAALILGGLIIMLKPKRNRRCTPHREIMTNTTSSVDIDVVFGGRKEIVTSKDFSGGRATAIFGGAEINLIQADSNLPGEPMVLEVRAIFGGLEIIVPANWDIKNEVETIFGSVEDQRTLRTPDTGEIRKTLLLKGSCIFGGIEIKSF